MIARNLLAASAVLTIAACLTAAVLRSAGVM